ncbi:MAG: hypothetical protein H6677_01785 [Candidatus Obscuribacterales bacterium]|nr:hypothetical protein [Candidatus Obscuribacterales bacterium]
MTDSSKKSPVSPVKFLASIEPKDDANPILEAILDDHRQNAQAGAEISPDLDLSGMPILNPLLDEEALKALKDRFKESLGSEHFLGALAGDNKFADISGTEEIISHQPFHGILPSRTALTYEEPEIMSDLLANFELMMLLSRRSDGIVDEPDLDQALEVQMMRKIGEEIVLPQTASEEESES